MKYPDNIKELLTLPVDMMGLIFYPKSPRYVVGGQDEIVACKQDVKFVGVFVNETVDTVLHIVRNFELDFVQLHGNEPVEYCSEVRKSVPVIKAFSVADRHDFEQTQPYEGLCDYFLFDTKTPAYGGSGHKFDWTLLDCYMGKTPFLLSGGIAIDDAQAIKKISHPLLYGIDLNSRFEIEPAVKDISMLKQFINEIKNHE